VGLLLAAPVLASLKLYGRYAWRKLLDLPPFPVEEEKVVEHKPMFDFKGLLGRFSRSSTSAVTPKDLNNND
jgi:hypothetical protein